MDITKLNRIKDKIRLNGYQMKPVLSNEEVDDFEKRCGIILPDEYRLFITQVGKGGDGPPFYGMYSLDEAYINTKEFNKNSKNFLSEEFPLKEYWIWENEAHWTDELKKKKDCVYNGNLILGTDGCAQYWTLIITGSQRGQVWMLADVGAQPCAPSLSFWDWYEYWLDGGSDWWREFQY